MALIDNSKALSLENGVLSFSAAGAYTFNYKKFVQVMLESGQTTNLTQDEYDSIVALDIRSGAHVTMLATEVQDLEIANLDGTLDIVGVGAFVEAGPDDGFETSTNLDSVIGSAVDAEGAGAVAARLTVDGSKIEAFKLIWDYLDDGYTAGNNYYDLNLNENFVRLGIEYVNYLEAGGEPLTFLTAKYNADTNADGIPQREQSMHDNLLGNLNAGALNDRFGGDLLADLLVAIPDEYETRPYFDGAQASLGGPAHDAVRAYDWDHGWDRPDYLDMFLGEVDERAQDTAEGDMIMGDGISTVNYAITRHEGAGVELALKAKIRGVGDYDSDQTVVNEDGTVSYFVSATPPSSTRASWNIDWAATVTGAGDDEDGLTFKFLLDTDPTTGESFVDLLETRPWVGAEETGDPTKLQNSWNYGFFSETTEGVSFDVNDGAGTFTARLEAYDDGELLAAQTIYIVAA